MRTLPVVLLALVLAVEGSAQDTSPDRRFGVGVSFNPGALSVQSEEVFILPQTGFNNLLFPIRTPSVTIEPELGLTRSSVERKASGPGGTFTDKFAVRTLRYGIGVLRHFARRDNLEPYLGPRVGFQRYQVVDENTGTSFSSSEKTTFTNWHVAGALGGQYHFGGHMTLGGEAQLRYTGLGNPKVEQTGGTPPSPSSQSGGSLETIGLITLRWFF